MNYYLIDDQGRGKGGAEMTLNAVLEGTKHHVVVIKTSELPLSHIESPDLIILGNISDIRTAPVATEITRIIEKERFVKIEFDYGFIPYRGKIPYQKFTGLEYLNDNEHIPITKLWKKIREKAEHIFYMSSQQKKIFTQFLGAASAKEHILSSCFLKDDLVYMRELRTNSTMVKPFTRDLNRWFTIEGQDEWQSWCKGTENAKIHAKNIGVELDIISTKTHKELLFTMATYGGFMLLPNIHDTCPRTVIEARLCGCKVNTNIYVQHRNENWFKDRTPDEIEQYIKNKPTYFWDTVKKINQ